MPRRKRHKLKILPVVGVFLALIAILRFVQVNPHWQVQSRKAPDCRAQVEAQWKVEAFDAVGKIISCDALEQVNKTYVGEIKPIFAAKCLNCHGQTQSVPLYAVLPPTSWLVREHRWEAQEHLDMSHDFPFKGHHTQEENLEDIQKVIDRGTMPPLYYVGMHWGSRLTPAERKKVIQWVDSSMRQLN